MENQDKKREITKLRKKYYDIDGICFILSFKKYKNIYKTIKKTNISISNKIKASPKILNKSKLTFNNLNCVKKLTSIYLCEISTDIGRFNIFILFNDKKFNTSLFYDKLYSLNIKKKSSYIFNSGNTFKLTNISLFKLFKILNELEYKNKTEIYLYGEKYGNKYEIMGKNEFANIFNNKPLIFDIHPYQFDYIEIDICKNISMTEEKNYFTSIKLKKSISSGKNYFESLTPVPINEYNFMNDQKYHNYHASNTKIEIYDEKIFIKKINLYNPIINNICNDLYNKSEIFNKKFIHECLYTANDLKFCSIYKNSNKYQNKNNQELENNIDNYVNLRNFYRCEYKYGINNLMRKFKKLSSDEIKNIFKYYKIFNSKKYIKFKIYKISKFKKMFKSNLNYIKKINQNIKLGYKELSKKIFCNVIFFEYFKKGGMQTHYLLKNSDRKILINRNTSMKTILTNNINLFEDLNFCHNIIKNYVSSVYIKNEIKQNFIKIFFLFNNINTSEWKKNIIESFLQITANFFNIEIDDMFNLVENEKLKIIENINLSEFTENFFLKYVFLKKPSFKNLYYSNLIFAIKLLKEKYPIEQLCFDNYISKKKIFDMKIPFKHTENGIIYFYKIKFDKLPSKQEFKREIIKGISNSIKKHDIIRQKKDKFYFTLSVKKLYCYLRDTQKYTNTEFIEDTKQPLWIMFILRTRLQNLKKQLNKTQYDWEKEIVPDVLINTKEKYIDFINNNLFFKESIDISNNIQFKKLIFYLFDIDYDDEYSLSKEDYFEYKRHLENLEFKTINDNVNNNKKIQTVDNIILSINEEYIIFGKVLTLINILKHQRKNLKSITLKEIVEYIDLDITIKNNICKEKIIYHLMNIVNIEPLSSFFEVENINASYENINFLYKN